MGDSETDTAPCSSVLAVIVALPLIGEGFITTVTLLLALLLLVVLVLAVAGGRGSGT